MSTFNARAALFLLSATLLAGCGRTPAGGGNASGAAPGAATLIEPGRWEITVISEPAESDSFGAPQRPINPDGPPPYERETRTRTKAVCVPGDLAAKPNPALIVASDQLRRCALKNWNVRDGRIDGEFACPGGAGEPGPVPTHVTGTYDREHFENEWTLDAFGFTFREKVSGTHAGACTGGEGYVEFVPRG